MNADRQNRTSPHHASGNGMFERYHRFLNALLAKVVSANQRDWMDHLQTAVAAYRSTPHESIKMIPNRAFLGREVRLPVNLVMGSSPELGNGETCVSDIVEGMVERMRANGVFKRTQLGRAAVTMKTRYDAKIKPAYDLHVGG